MRLKKILLFVSQFLWHKNAPTPVPDDPEFDLGFEVSRHKEVIGANTYHYLLSKPAEEPKATVVLLHGFPDLSFGWRYQIPHLASLGYQVITPDMLGYGRSSAPRGLAQYSHRSVADDIAELVQRIVPGEQVILGGHDWGGALVYRAALWHPELFKGIFSVCTPYFPPATEYTDTADKVADGTMPNFGYQLQLRDPPVDAKLAGPDKIRSLLKAFYGARTPEGEMGFDATVGLLWDNLADLGPSPLVPEDMMEYYVEEYAKNTMRGPLSWYRTERINFDEELPLAEAGQINFTMPGLFIGATQDTALPPELSLGMEAYFERGLTRDEVNSSHWALWQAAQDVSAIIGNWMATVD